MINSTVKYVAHFRSFMYGGSTVQCLTELKSCAIRGTTVVPEVQSLTSVAA
jgi:hypothetical protein